MNLHGIGANTGIGTGLELFANGGSNDTSGVSGGNGGTGGGTSISGSTKRFHHSKGSIELVGLFIYLLEDCDDQDDNRCYYYCSNDNGNEHDNGNDNDNGNEKNSIGNSNNDHDSGGNVSGGDSGETNVEINSNTNSSNTTTTAKITTPKKMGIDSENLSLEVQAPPSASSTRQQYQGQRQ